MLARGRAHTVPQPPCRRSVFPLARTCVPALQAEWRCVQLVADLAAQLAVQGAQAALARLRWPVLREVPHDWGDLLGRAGWASDKSAVRAGKGAPPC